MTKCTLCENTTDHMYANVGPDLSCAMSKLDRIEVECNGKDWDTYGADRVTPSALSTARTLVGRLANLGMGPHCIVPTNQGGISFTWYLGDDSEGIHMDISKFGLDDPIGLWSSDADALLTMITDGLRNYAQTDSKGNDAHSGSEVTPAE